MSDSIVRDLFLGELRNDLILPYPFLDADEAEMLGMVRETIARFAADHIDPTAIDQAHAIPQDVFDGLGEIGFYGLRIPEEHGGLDLNTTQYVRVCQDLSRYDGATAIMSGGHSTIGIKALLLYGTDEQKQRYLPRLATGELKAAFALSEPDAGSDAQSLKCTATRRDDGSYEISGEKLWITNGGFADLVTLFVRTPDHPRDDGRPSISCFLVEKSMGYVPGKEEEKLGIRGSSTVPLLFDKVVVPAENLVGLAGDGFRLALEILNSGRTSLAGNCLGAGRFLLEETARYTEERAQFGRPIARFPLIQEKLGRMAQDLHALECMLYLTTGLIDRVGMAPALESALCKVFGTEVLWATVNDAVQCAGGNGFTTDYPFERMLRDARVNMIFEGTNEILRVMVATSGLAGPLKRAGEADSLATDYGRRATGREAPDPLPVPAALQAESLALSMAVADLAQAAAKLVGEHGKAVRGEQLACAALSDMALAAYAQAAVLSRAAAVVDAGGEEAAAEELLLAQGACRRLARRGREAAGRLRDHDDELLFKTAETVCKLGGLPGERP